MVSPKHFQGISMASIGQIQLKFFGRAERSATQGLPPYRPLSFLRLSPHENASSATLSLSSTCLSMQYRRHFFPRPSSTTAFNCWRKEVGRTTHYLCGCRVFVSIIRYLRTMLHQVVWRAYRGRADTLLTLALRKSWKLVVL